MSKQSLWLEFVVDAVLDGVGSVPICGLCGNTGKIDTTNSAVFKGKPCGIKGFCICPNGRALKRMEKR